MNSIKTIENALKCYKLNKARIAFLERRVRRYELNNGDDLLGNFILDIEKELGSLNYTVQVVEDALEILDGIDERYKVIIEKYYIDGFRMEEVADAIHVSRSRCYELCKEAVAWLNRLIWGEGMYHQQIYEPGMAPIGIN